MSCAVREAGIPPAVRARFLTKQAEGRSEQRGRLRRLRLRTEECGGAACRRTPAAAQGPEPGTTRGIRGSPRRPGGGLVTGTCAYGPADYLGRLRPGRRRAFDAQHHGSAAANDGLKYPTSRNRPERAAEAVAPAAGYGRADTLADLRARSPRGQQEPGARKDGKRNGDGQRAGAGGTQRAATGPRETRDRPAAGMRSGYAT